MQDKSGGSSLLIEEYFETGDARFLDEILRSTSALKLKSFADRWYDDRRPFAREMLLRYIDDGCDRPHHRPLVKRLFKRADAARDDEAMGHFMVAFDRLMRRRKKVLHHWDWQARAQYTTVVLRSDPAEVPRGPAAAGLAGRFSRLTRMYLMRRAWRYFRVMAWREPERYLAAMRRTLPRYRDEDLATPPQLLDAWGLMHALYWASPVLDRTTKAGVAVADGHTLAELRPAPIALAEWQKDSGPLVELLLRGESRTVRQWAIEMLRAYFPEFLRGAPFARVRAFLLSPHDEVQTLGVEMLREATGIETLSIDEWLALLEIQNVQVVTLIAELVEKHVAPERLTLAQLVTLAGSRIAPVAELAWRWLQSRALTADELPLLLLLANAEVPSVRVDAMRWLLERTKEPATLRELIDSRFADVRAVALEVMGEGTEELWRALAESPYPDVREHLIAHLRAAEQRLDPRSVRHLWASSLLAIHRGGRAKQLVVKQIAQRIAAAPAQADELLPLLAIALRSIRAPERRAALGALAQAAFVNPALRDAIGRHLPELVLFPEEAA